ncbi:MAG: hypothetical protein PVI98_11930, partial [Burkholderiales bacterium]
HTVPVIWITPASSGTAPAAVLLGFALATVFTFEHGGVSNALMVLGFALAWCSFAWLLAWLIARSLDKLSRSARSASLAAISGFLLASVYWPIYIVGGQYASQRANIIELFNATPGAGFLLAYWVGLHAIMLALFAAYLQRQDHPFIAFVERWRSAAATVVASALIAIVLVGDYPKFICWPLAKLGSAQAALCVARSAKFGQRDWYRHAAELNQRDAIAWMISHTPEEEQKLFWLRKGAGNGDAQFQLDLHEQLRRSAQSDDHEEAAMWLRLSAANGHTPAQLALAETLTRNIYSSGSRDQLAERNDWLERAASRGARDAKRQLAQHHVEGSMGYPVDLGRARDWYRELANAGERTSYERVLGFDAAYYKARIAELDRWQAGLDKRDPEITRLLASRYLGSPFPGPGVRELGQQLMQQLADEGAASAIDALNIEPQPGKDTGTGTGNATPEAANAS